MNAKSPIVILGFGRSGTTWVADILSKCLGGVVLFEPFHPSVCDFSEDLYYAHHWELDDISNHWNRIANKEVKNRWLLRNHLNSPLEQIRDTFIDLIWDNSSVLGFKSIRLNYSISSVAKAFSATPVFIIRHPLAVIASIINRPQFWEEYGWHKHWDSFHKSMNSSDHPQELILLTNTLKKYEAQVALMWSMAHVAALADLERLNVTPFYYEDLYLNPYEQSRRLLDYIGYSDINIHPSYIFTPSMMTLRTVHELSYDSDHSITGFPEFFWRDHLSNAQVKMITDTIHKVCQYDTRLHTLCYDRKYLTNDIS